MQKISKISLIKIIRIVSESSGQLVTIAPKNSCDDVKIRLSIIERQALGIMNKYKDIVTSFQRKRFILHYRKVPIFRAFQEFINLVPQIRSTVGSFTND